MGHHGMLKFGLTFILGMEVVAPKTLTATAAPSLAKEQVLRLGNKAEPRELDPSKATGVPESRILYNLFEGLTSLEPITLEPIPGVAESWKVSDDGKTYTFQLRKAARWSDGTPLTAHDFVASWQRALSPELASEYAYQLYYIANGMEYNTGKVKEPSKLGVKALNDHTLEVTLVNPTSYFLKLVSFYTYFPTPTHMVKKFPGQEWTKEGRMVSNGPFKLAEWKLNQHIKLVPNETYWDKDRVTLKEAYFLPIENVQTEEKAFLTGELHMTSTVPVSAIPNYLEEKKKKPTAYHPFRADPYLATYFYRFNTTRKPFDDPRVRKALALGIDRKIIAEHILRGGELPATSFVPPNMGSYAFEDTLPERADQKTLQTARKLLAEAGYPDGKGFPEVSILYNTDEKHKKIALALQQMWRKNLNIRVGLYNQEWKVYLNTQASLNYDMARASWIGDYSDPMTFLGLFTSQSGKNNTGWSNKQYDNMVAKASKLLNEEKRFAAFEQAEALLMEEMPILPIYFYTSNKLLSEKVKLVDAAGTLQDWQPNIQDVLLLKYYALAP